MLKLLLALSSFCLFSFTAQEPAAPAAPSSIPPEAAHMVNPVKPTAESQAHAKKMYGYDCAMCHGPNGNGKGDMVADMKLTLKDYTDPASLKDLSDGELFYIIKNGKGEMEGEGQRVKPENTWDLVNYIRSFSKLQSATAAQGPS